MKIIPTEVNNKKFIRGFCKFVQTSPTKENIYIFNEGDIKDGEWCLNIYTDKVGKFPSSDFTLNEFMEFGWRKILATTDEYLHIPYTLFEDGDLEIYRYRIFPTVKPHEIEYFKNEKLKSNVITCLLEWDTRDHDEWIVDLDNELFIDYQKEMGIYGHDLGVDISETMEMYKNHFKVGIYVDPDNNTVNILKNDLTPISEVVVVKDRVYSQDEVEKLIRWAMESRGFTSEIEVRQFFKKHGIADYPY